MFRKINEEPDLEGISDFIEKPSQECTNEELEKNINQVLIVLSKNPSAIMDIIANHPFIPATFLLDDLAEKMRKQNCLEKLGLLFDKCLDKLVEASVYNIHDLTRCINIMPSYIDKVMQTILSHEKCIRRIFESEKNPQDTLNQMVEMYPEYKEKFSECYERYYNNTLMMK